MTPKEIEEMIDIKLKAHTEQIGVEVTRAIDAYFAKKGKVGTNVLITTATIIGSLTVIFGGFKAILAWLGFEHIMK